MFGQQAGVSLSRESDEIANRTDRKPQPALAKSGGQRQKAMLDLGWLTIHQRLSGKDPNLGCRAGLQPVCRQAGWARADKDD